ncbi:formylglycine-generating enzyme isoform X3 [Ctenocephalides felis]|uniref:formylglycine-generating enzyme isoform X3 n=1 Tax=Ctenocephalides felis TaxID=7515 RepID=UPI000E6E4492|nr:formylglycine-generating enzyme isoform X3 [Ctenocephalides felis]
MRFVLIFRHTIIYVFLSVFVEDAFCGCGCDGNRKNSLTNTISQRSLFYQNIISQDTCSNVNFQYSNMTLIPTGIYEIGTDKRQFNEFVKATKYVTEAEKFGDSFVFKSFLRPETQKQYKDFRVVGSPWWYKIPLANWFQPEGTGSNINSPDRWDHPVVHISWNDAVSYCKWRNGSLPTEHEWEIACKGKKRNKLYPWGNKLVPQGKHRMNVWQGQFPHHNTKEDGWVGTSPVGTYPANDFNIFDITGNVWEWTSDLWDPHNPKVRRHVWHTKCCNVCILSDIFQSNERVKKGGSYLCHESYCNRYRCSARSQNTADSTAGNLGFRCCLHP